MSWQEIAAAGRIGVAVSGGADSVYLLHELKNLGVAAAVLHVNHRLRGEESDSDEAFVSEMAIRLALPFHALIQTVSAGNIEQQARQARYTFFKSCIGAGICSAVATGHTLDDQTETVLGRFLRGSGTAGLSGILPVTTGPIIRPLLTVRREQIRTSLLERGICWREDRSNINTDFLRNRLRLDLIPQLESLNPSLPQVLASTATWAQGEEDYWSGEVARLERKHLHCEGDSVLIQTAAVCEFQPAVQRRLLRRAVEIVRGSLRAIDFRHIEAVRALTGSREGSGRLQLPGLDVYRSFDLLRLAPAGYDSRLDRDFEVTLSLPGRTSLHELRLTIDLELLNAPAVYNNQMNVLDWPQWAGAQAKPVIVRNWRPGDSYQPIGRSTPIKIKTLFQEYRVPLWERRTWPVITQGGTILWTRRFGSAVKHAARLGSVQVLLISEPEESNRGFPAS